MHTTEEIHTTRDKILEAALKLFSEKGYLGATTREIAREAGVAEITLFRHFPSKEKLLEEVINTYTFLPELKALLPEISQMAYEEALTAIAGRFLHTLNLRRDMIRIMHSEMHRYPEKVRRIYNVFIDELYKTLASYFRDLQGKGVLREFDAKLAGRALLGTVFSYFNAQQFLARKRQKSTEPERVIREFVGIFVRGTLK